MAGSDFKSIQIILVNLNATALLDSFECFRNMILLLHEHFQTKYRGDIGGDWVTASPFKNLVISPLILITLI